MRYAATKTYLPAHPVSYASVSLTPLLQGEVLHGCAFGIVSDVRHQSILAVFDEIFTSFVQESSICTTLPTIQECETAITHALSTATSSFFDALAHGRITLSQKDTALLLGVVLFNRPKITIFFSGVGALSVWAGDMYTATTTHTLFETRLSTHWTEPFSELHTGTLPNQQSLFAAPSDLFTHLPQTFLAQSLQKSSPALALEKSVQYLHEQHTSVALPLVLINTPKERTIAITHPPQHIPRKKTAISSSPSKSIGQHLFATTTPIRNFARKIRHTLTNYVQRGTAYAPLFLRRVLQKGYGIFQRLPVLQRILLMLLALLLTILFINIGQHTSTKIDDNREQIFREQKARAEQFYQEAQAARIYGNEREAIALVRQALTLTHSLPDHTNTYRQEGDRINTQLTTLLHELQHYYPVDILEPVIDFTARGTYAAARPHLMTTTDESLLVYDPAYQQLWNLSFATSVPEIIPTPTAQHIVASTDRTLLFTQHEQNVEVVDVDLQQSTTRSLGTLAVIPHRAGGTAFYNNTLYILDPTKRQIHKVKVFETSLGAEQAWIEEPYGQITRAVDLAVDGDIYILTPESLVKYTRGKQSSLSFDKESIDPPLEPLQKITTDTSGDYLYLTESQGTRIIVLTKDGKLAAQYQFATPLHTFAIREQERTGYVLIDTTLYAFTLEHIEEDAE